MLIKITGRFPKKFQGRIPAIGDVLEVKRAYAKVFIALGCAEPHTPPRPDIPASPSTPVNVVAESSATPSPTPQEENSAVAPEGEAPPAPPVENTVTAPEKSEPPKADAESGKKARAKQPRRDTRAD